MDNDANQELTRSHKLNLVIPIRIKTIEAVKSLARGPLGIIALFLVFAYGVAALVLGIGARHLTTVNQTLLVLFIVLFPIILLTIFYLLI